MPPTRTVTSSTDIHVLEVTEAWDEGTGSGDGATWDDRQTGRGLEFARPTAAHFDTSPIDTLTTSSAGLHTWDVTSLVQDWYAGTKTNYGLMLASDDTGDREFDYDSS